jgi:hypothetical protein
MNLDRNAMQCWAVALTALTSSVACTDTTPDEPPTEAPAALHAEAQEALRSRFPAHADRVLASEHPFVASERGFSLGAPRSSAGFRGPGIELPADASDPILFRDLSQTEVRVYPIGVVGEGVQTEGAVAYRREGGASFWTAARGGVEEWLHLDAEVVRAGKAVAAWQIEGATVCTSAERPSSSWTRAGSRASG